MGPAEFRFPLAKRFYQIALELGVRPRKFIRELSDLGLSVGNQMVVIADELEERIHDIFRISHGDGANAAEVEPNGSAIDGSAIDGSAIGDAAIDGGAMTGVAQPATTVGVPGSPALTGSEVHADSEVQVGPQEQAIGEDIDSGPSDAEPMRPAAAAQATDVEPEKTADGKSRRRIEDRRPQGELIPTIDPRIGGLVQDAKPGMPIPGVTSPRTPRGRGAPSGPNLPSTQGGYERAPGVTRDGRTRRAPTGNRWGGRKGSRTFDLRNRRGGRRRGAKRPAAPKVHPTSVDVSLPITVKKFGELTLYKAAEIIKVLFKEHKMMLTPNSSLDKETLEILGIELEIEVNFVTKETAEEGMLKAMAATREGVEIRSRPPVVAILGHVDHGKTTLLDNIRESDVAGRESGGITQHIGASQVTLEDGRKVTFLDTPGHEAFTEMRARGAEVTDVVVLIVAGDDGVMPQTVEAISHAKAAGVQIVVAVTKIDKDGVNVERVKQQLTEHEVYVEGYGGDISLFGVSGITGEGVKELLEHIALMAEVDADKFSAAFEGPAEGVVIESQNSPRRGVLATVLVQQGTLKKGDSVLVGDAFGTVRAMFNDRGSAVRKAEPGDPVEIVGLDRAPVAGSRLYVAKSTTKAKQIADTRRQRQRELDAAAKSKPASVESLFESIASSKVTEVNLVVKADVSGSLEPLKRVLVRLNYEDEVRVNIVHAAVGAINDSDVVLAAASGATVIGFHVDVDSKARERAKRSQVDIRSYKIIYDIENDVRDMVEGKLAPELEEVILGHAEVLAIFRFSKIGNIAGCRVKDGILKRECKVRVFRGEEQIHEGDLATLRREKDEVKEVREGFECGLTVKNWDEFEEGDRIEAYEIIAKKRMLKR